MSVTDFPRYWFVVPAAGVGARMNASVPKQYLTLHGKTVLEHTLERILQVSNLAGIVVAIGEFDKHWNGLSIASHPLIHRIDGGAERANSVLNSLHFLQDKAAANDWVLVHDAARPCVTLENIETLCNELAINTVGGILAIPVSDTIKHVDERALIQKTIDRRCLWQAQTPQMFRYQLILDCLSQTLSRNENITDESSAVELCGYQPQVIEGRADNIKITRPDDLRLAEFILNNQHIQEKYS